MEDAIKKLSRQRKQGNTGGSMRVSPLVFWVVERF
jgi:hypothetical protein